MAALFCAAAGAKSPSFDLIATRDGGELRILFFGHGSVGFEYGGRYLYVDPVSDYADWAALPKADVIVVTHEHGDHLDMKAVEALAADHTVGFTTAAIAERHGRPEAALGHGERRELPFVAVEAMPAYNTSPEKQNFHPKASLHNGYVLTFGGTRVYVAGDSEPTPEMLALKDIDVAFLPVNLPYTMTEEQAAEAVRAIRPRIFYPYHYGGTDHKTDLDKLRRLIDGSGVEMRVRPLE
jgi:L-ascorbate metabolism protein UlaG (beta-lactamase superfamily)